MPVCVWQPSSDLPDDEMAIDDYGRNSSFICNGTRIANRHTAAASPIYLINKDAQRNAATIKGVRIC